MNLIYENECIYIESNCLWIHLNLYLFTYVYICIILD